MIYFMLFLTFMKIGAFTFGGGYAMLPLIQSEVIKQGWLTIEELLNFIAISESTPGPFAANIATYVGIETVGILGAICATLGVVLPSFVIILIIAKFYEKFKNNKYVDGIMVGLKPAVVGLIGSVVISIGQTVFFNQGLSLDILKDLSFYISLAIFILCTALIFNKKHPIMIICLSAVIGIVSGYIFAL